MTATIYRYMGDIMKYGETIYGSRISCKSLTLLVNNNIYICYVVDGSSDVDDFFDASGIAFGQEERGDIVNNLHVMHIHKREFSVNIVVSTDIEEPLEQVAHNAVTYSSTCTLPQLHGNT